MKNPESMTQKELAEEIAALEKLMSEGNGTVDAANRLAKIRKCLHRIESVRNGLNWD